MKTSILTSSQLQAEYNSLSKTYAENTNKRMENYFNCVDDYSWGGLCDQAQAESLGSLEMLIGLLKEQEENGAVKRNYSVFVLCSLDGKELSSNVIKTKFGYCFIIEGETPTFVGIPKNMKTLTKKGYMVKEVVYNVDIIYTGRAIKNGNPLIHSSKINNVTVAETPNMQYCTPWHVKTINNLRYFGVPIPE